MDLGVQEMTERTDIAIDLALTWLPPLVKAILMLWIGFKAIARIGNFVTKAMKKAKVDTTISKFTASLVSVTLKVFLLISIAGVFGIQTTSFIALIGAAGLAIGMSLQGSLSNLAGGVMLLMFKPYKVGDYVEIQGVRGHVDQIGVLNTTITTVEHNTAIIPNGPIINDTITNYSTVPTSRVDVSVGISYDADIDEARKVLLAMLAENEYVLDKPETAVFVKELADSSVNLIVRGYVKDKNHYPAFFDITEQTKKALDKAKIDIPYPQRVVHTVK